MDASNEAFSAGLETLLVWFHLKDQGSILLWQIKILMW